MKKAIWHVFVLLIVSAMLLTACGTPAPVATEAPAMTEAPAATGTFLERAFAGEFSGTVVTATGPFVDADAQKFDSGGFI
jgi:hypothetical protein